MYNIYKDMDITVHMHMQREMSMMLGSINRSSWTAAFNMYLCMCIWIGCWLRLLGGGCCCFNVCVCACGKKEGREGMIYTLYH